MRTADIMKGPGTKISEKAKDTNGLAMGIYMKGSIKKEKFKAKEFINGKMVIFMMASGMKGKNMDMGFGKIQLVTGT